MKIDKVIEEAILGALRDPELFKKMFRAFLQKQKQVVEALFALTDTEPEFVEEEPMLGVLLYALEHGEDLFNDPLTRVRDGRLFRDGVYDKLIAEAERYKHPLSVVIIDVDDFKAINDTFGHLAGDRALERVASILSKEAKRGIDIVIRHGGDEFLLILPHTEATGAGVLMGRIEKVLSTLSPRVSISFGINSWIPGSDSISLGAMVKAADMAMYKHKQGKRT
ncbi:GGDEF domain-containing protein [Patescibacteria group bacterium]|nr:GGDEF domain-containing protein [Patescibacteria group bacterium]MBU4162173.1 GGDEF domain-containing protein [Patescibacteria group bacterium]